MEQNGEMGRKTKALNTIAYYLSTLCLGLVISIIGPSLPSLAEKTNTRLHEIGFLFTTLSLGYLLGSILGGRLYDRVIGHPLLGGSIIVFSAVTIMVPLMGSLMILVSILLFLGIAEGFLDVGCNTLLVWVHKRKVGPYMNGLHFFFGAGALLSPLIVEYFLRVTGGIKWAYWSIAIFFIPLAVFILKLSSPGIESHSHTNDRRVKDPLLILLVAVFFFFHVGAELSYGGWIYTYILKLGIASTTTAAYVTSVFWGSFTLSRLAGIPLAIKFKPEIILTGSLSGCILASVLLHIWPQSTSIIWAGTILMGISVASLFPTGINYIEQKMHISGSITSWILVGSSSGSMFFPWIIGRLFESISLRIFPLFMLGIYICALLIILTTFGYVLRNRERFTLQD